MSGPGPDPGQSGWNHGIDRPCCVKAQQGLFVGQGPVSVVSFSGEKRTGNNKTTCYAGGEVSFSLPVKNLPRYNNVGLPATLMYLGGVHGQ